jgi:hypothetical protein
VSTVLSKKYLSVAWGDYSFATRRWRYRRNRRASSVYVQFGPLEIVVWYR